MDKRDYRNIDIAVHGGLPTYIICGKINGLFQSTFIKCDRAHIDGMVAGSKWKSMTIFEMPTEPIYDMNDWELAQYRADIRKKSEEEKERELFLELKKKYEPECQA